MYRLAHPARLLARCGQLLRAWQLEPWDVGPFRSMPRWYRLTAPLVVVTLLSVAGAVLVLAPVSWRPLQDFSIAWVILITAALSLLNFQTSDTHGSSPAMVTFVALLISGHTPDALACGLTYCLVNPIRKPTPGHLVLLNVAFLGTSAILGTVVQQAIGVGLPFTAEWLAAAACASLMYFVTNAPLYLTFADVHADGWAGWLGGWWSDAKGEMFELLPMAVALGAGLSFQQWPALLLLAVPGLTSYYTFSLLGQVMRAQEQANRDPLTGIANRRLFDTELATASDAVHASGNRAWVLLLDLDDFKRLNDTRGHDAGDDALRRAATALRTSVRGKDFCGRYGGEEFVVILNDASREDTSEVAERIRSSIARALDEYAGTASVGVAPLERGRSAEGAVQLADQALYHSKRSGKNRVTFADELPDGASTTEAA